MRPTLSLLRSAAEAPAAAVAARSSVVSMLAVPPSWAWYDILIAGYLGLTAVSLALKPEEVARATPWSKWAIGYNFKTPVSARTGMLVKYLPAVGLAGWLAASQGGLMPALMLAHFGKRCVEVLAVHDFSGSPTEELYTCGFISLFYAMVAWLLMRDGAAADPAIAAAGLATFVVGQAGNLYHHALLAGLRRSEGPKYRVPQGGLFEYCGCPHYLCEVVSWFGAALVAQNAHAFLVAFWVAGMLGGRSVVTTRWYRDRFGDAYPASRRHIVPFVL